MSFWWHFRQVTVQEMAKILSKWHFGFSDDYYRIVTPVYECWSNGVCIVRITHREVKLTVYQWHDDVIKWKHFPRNWPFVRGIHRSPVNSQHKGQWRGALMFSLICVWINDGVNNREAGDLRRYRLHYDVIVMKIATLLEITCYNLFLGTDVTFVVLKGYLRKAS